MCPRHCPEEFKKPKERKSKGRSALKKQVISIHTISLKQGLSNRALRL
jgi:hypothetical protein